MSPEENRALLRRAIERFNDPEDRIAYIELYDPDIVLHGFPPGLAPGLEGVEQFYAAYWAAFPDVRVTIEDVIGEGDKLVARYTVRATHRGEFMGIPATGKRVTFEGITILRFEGGKCVERWQSADMLGLLQQLGAVPTPGQSEEAAVT
jgi:steroid delta-isomerase-like uncharacterized protein